MHTSAGKELQHSHAKSGAPLQATIFGSKKACQENKNQTFLCVLVVAISLTSEIGLQ